MKKIFIACLLLCVPLLHAQERFFLYGKVLGADGMPLPSAQASLSTVIERQPIASTNVSSDGSFKLVVSGHALALLTFTGFGCDSLTLPLLLTTEQRTLNMTVRLPLQPEAPTGLGPQRASIQMQYGNTELGIAEKLMMAMMEEKRLAGRMTPLMNVGIGTDAAGNGAPAVHAPDPDSVLARLEKQIRAEQNPLHRDAFLLRYMQFRTGTKRPGNAAIVNMALNLIDPASPFWPLVPELIKASASTPEQYGEYVRLVKQRTPDPELNSWLDAHP